MRCLGPFAHVRTVPVLTLAVLVLSLAAAEDAAAQPPPPSGVVTDNFELLGHHDLGLEDTNGDVWVHGDFAYVGTWALPCTARGVKIIDVSDLRAPQFIGTLASRVGTSAEDVVVRSVSTPSFTGDLLATGIQRCDYEDQALNEQRFGVEFWDVSDPRNPTKLSELSLVLGFGGVHELDLFQRGENVYALLATPFTEGDPFSGGGDFRIVDVTDPRNPEQVSEWGAFAHGVDPGPNFTPFNAFIFGHSARASADGTKAYVSYWDLGVLTLDITDVTNPVLISQTQYPPGADGEAHSVTEYQGEDRLFLLQNDEDFDPHSPVRAIFAGGEGIANESGTGTPLWHEPRHRVKAPVVLAANQGCEPGDYPPASDGSIVVVRLTFGEFEPPPCFEDQQEALAAAAGAVAVVHDFVFVEPPHATARAAGATAARQRFNTQSRHLHQPDGAPHGVDIPVLFTDHATVEAIVAAGRATLKAREPSFGFLRVFDAASGQQVAEFDEVPNVHSLPSPPGDWTIHNTEVTGDRAYISWYSNGIVALDLEDLNGRRPDDPEMAGQFIPEGAPSHVPEILADGVPNVWGVAIRLDSIDEGGGDNDDDDEDSDRARRRDNDEDGGEAPVIFLSDMNGGLWIVRPTGEAALNR